MKALRLGWRDEVSHMWIRLRVWAFGWDGYIHDTQGDVVYWKKLLFRFWWRGVWHVRLHKFVKSDPLDCFHTHPSHAWRLILRTGYVEEEYSHLPKDCVAAIRRLGALPWNVRIWRPGMHGWVRPEFCHRIDSLLGSSSYSLWVMGPKVALVELYSRWEKP